MPTELKYDVGSASYSNMTDNVSDVTIDAVNTLGAGDQDETEFQNTMWSTYFGIYRSIAHVKTAIDMRAIWTLGKGWSSPDPHTSVLLDHVFGYGRDTFNSILKNCIVTRRIGGDAYCEIIRDEDGDLFNLKPLDPGSIKVVVDRSGRIKHYLQVQKVGKKEKGVIKFKPEEIFHLVNKRVADGVLGISDIECLQSIVEANNETFYDYKKVLHRTVKPIMGFKLDTDNPTKIAAFATKMDNIINKGENLYVPKDTVEYELISVPSNATTNPLPWLNHLKDTFFQVVGIPQIILGSSGEFTESTAKIAFLAFEQSVKDEQNDISEAIWNQLAMRVDLNFAVSIQNEMLSDTQKDGSMQQTGASLNPPGMEE